MGSSGRRRVVSGLVAAALGPILVAGAGCGAGNVPGAPDARLGAADRALVGPWLDRAGGQLPDGTAAAQGILVINSFGATTTCRSGRGTVFIQLSWPIGRRVDIETSTPADAPWYLRDTTDAVGTWTTAESDLDTTLPDAARETGFHRAGTTLSVVPGDRSAIFLTRSDGTVERWAKVKDGVGCA